MATVASHKRLFTYYQKDGTKNHTYHCGFLNHIKTIETYGGLGAVGIVPTFLGTMLKDMEKAGIIKDATNPSDSERAQVIKAVRDEYLTALMLSGSNRDKFGPLCMDLKNQFGFGDDRYPKTIDQCLSLLNRWGHTPPASSNSPHTPRVFRCQPMTLNLKKLWSLRRALFQKTFCKRFQGHLFQVWCKPMWGI
jgi:hypothetical protein